MALQTGSNFTLSIAVDGGTLAPVGHAASCTLSDSTAMEPATTKASNGNEEVIPGRATLGISVTGFQDYETIAGTPAPINTPSSYALYKAKSKIDWTYTDDVSGDSEAGEGYISDFERTSEADVTAGYSFTITRTGASTFTAA